MDHLGFGLLADKNGEINESWSAKDQKEAKKWTDMDI